MDNLSDRDIVMLFFEEIKVSKFDKTPIYKNEQLGEKLNNIGSPFLK